MDKKEKKKKFFMVKLTALCVCILICICSFFMSSNNFGTVEGETEEVNSMLTEANLDNHNEELDNEENIEIVKMENDSEISDENVDNKKNYTTTDNKLTHNDNIIMLTNKEDEQNGANTVITSKETNNVIMEPGQVDYSINKYSNNKDNTLLIQEQNKKLLTGKVSTESISGEHFAIITIINNLNLEDKRTVTTRNSGVFEIEIPFGIYDIVIEKAGYLKYRIINIKIDIDTENLGERILTAGDTNGDGIIDFIDLTNVNIHTGLTRQDVDYDIKYDFNTDGVIDEKDKNILNLNYGESE